MESKFSKYLPGFQKIQNTQHLFLRVTEPWKSQLNNNVKVGAIILDL